MDSVISSIVEFFSGKIPNEITVFLISLMPVLELRGGLIAAGFLGILKEEPVRTFLVCFVGNMLPIPFILLFIRKIFDMMRHLGKLGRFIVRMEKKAEKHRGTIEKYGVWGLLLLVAIPLPGTGAWTGALVAACMDIRMRHALPVIAVGVLIAGLIVGSLSLGLIS